MSNFYEFSGSAVTVNLMFPIEHDGIKHNTITLNELTVEQVLELDKSNKDRTSFEQELHYFAKMAGKPVSMLLTLKERDWKRIRDAYWVTLGKSEQPLDSFE